MPKPQPLDAVPVPSPEKNGRVASGRASGVKPVPSCCADQLVCCGDPKQGAAKSNFLDLEKAYDRVPREELWYCMRKSGVAEKYVRVVQDMYERSRTVVRCAVVMDQLSEEVRREFPWTMMFADDIVICSESREQVEENLERWRFALERRGMKVSGSKTEYMCVNEREGSGTVRLQGEEVKEVQEFKYLGSTVQSNGECGKEVKKRVQAGWNGWRKVWGVLCERKISARIKGKVYRTVVRAAMLYGLETVSLRKRQESELEVAELKMLSFILYHRTSVLAASFCITEDLILQLHPVSQNIWSSSFILYPRRPGPAASSCITEDLILQLHPVSQKTWSCSFVLYPRRPNPAASSCITEDLILQRNYDSRLVYCTSLLLRLPASSIKPFQMIQQYAFIQPYCPVFPCGCPALHSSTAPEPTELFSIDHGFVRSGRAERGSAAAGSAERGFSGAGLAPVGFWAAGWAWGSLSVSLDLQHALGCFAAECEAAGMRVSTSKSEAMVLDRKKVACTLQVGGELLPQVEEFKYLGVLFTSEERMDREIDRRIGAAAAVMRSMYRSVVVKKELSQKAKL
ncbi:hypothetical protein QTP86_029288 [Hemibagrus guttatus]|nr:hypothetical protein QTP86_029288 [Hemibagrus guttatus]